MLQNLWEIYATFIGSIFMALIETAMFLASHGIAGLAIGFVACIAILTCITALAHKLG